MSGATSTAPVLQVEALRAYYKISSFGLDREVRAVDDVTFHVNVNEIYGLAGESSCGKTTLIKTIAAATKPPLRVVGGAVVFNFAGRRVDMQKADDETVDGIRWKHLSYIMQGSMSVLNPVRRIERAFVDFAFRHIGKRKPEFLDIVRTHLQRLDLNPDILAAYPHQLSGGMRQRVAIALATVCRPEFIIADEPTTALDVIVQNSVLAMIRDVQKEIGSSLIFVTHDLAVHANLCHRLGIMYAGRLVEEGSTADIFRTPKHPYTTHLVSSLPRIGNTAPKKALEGTPPSLAVPPPGCRFHPRCPLAMDICRTQNPPMVEVLPGRRVACFAVTPPGRAA
jgi:peptide/nickel transport system ATP-binding protein